MNCNHSLQQLARWGWVVVVAMAGFVSLARAEMHLPVLKSGTEVYSNVTVYSQNEHDLYIRHARGLGNVKINSLDDETLIALGLKEAEPATTTAQAVTEKASAWFERAKDKAAEFGVTLPVAAREPGKFLPQNVDSRIMAGALAGLVVLYWFSCNCLRLICCNAGIKPGVAIWFPLFQTFPLARAARMSGWVFLIPGVNLIAGFVWCLRIASACGKGPLTGVLLMLPGLNLFAILYLAFSRGPQANEGPQVVKLDGLSNA
jgi:hypothetical protein